MNPIEVIELKKEHLARLSNQRGAEGEFHVIDTLENLIPRPKSKELKNLLSALEETGISIKQSSFDAISHPNADDIDFTNPDSIKAAITEMIFVEIKSSNQDRVKEDFTGYFFALTESEIAASDALGNRHVVILYNKKTGVTLSTSVPAIIERAKSMNWQVSVQL